MKIIVQAIKPPIPVNWWDYRACIEGQEQNSELYGWGSTEEEAIANLADAVEAWGQNVETLN